MFTDIHTHAFHPKIARHAVEHLNEAYQLDCVGEGTIADLLLREKRSGIGRCVVLCAATTPGQVVPANDYAVTLQREHPEVTAFGTLHPGYEAWESQLERLKAAGIRGLKLHPDFQHFWLDDPRLLPMFEAAQDDFIFLFHIGDSVPPEKNPSCPYKLAALLDRFPRLRCIAGHLGGYHQWEHSLKALVGRDVWLDTSSCTPFIQPDLLKAILRKHPQDRILFGSDYPLYDPGDGKGGTRRRGSGPLLQQRRRSVRIKKGSAFRRKASLHTLGPCIRLSRRGTWGTCRLCIPCTGRRCRSWRDRGG